MVGDLSSQSWNLLGALSLLRNAEARLFRYSCPDCFEYLWSTLTGPNNVIEQQWNSHPCWKDESREFLALKMGIERNFPAEESPDVLIRYDGAPLGQVRPPDLPNIHFDTIFSPMVLYEMLALQNQVHLSGRRFVILAPHGMADPHDLDLAVARLLAPHIHVVEGYEPDLCSMLWSRIDRTSIDSRQVRAAANQLKLVLTDPARRHSVSNVVGPLQLLAGMEPSHTPDVRAPCKRPSARAAIDRLTQIIKLLEMVPASTEQHEPAPWVGFKEWSEDINRIILIDDMHDLGWAEFVRQALDVQDEDDRLLVCHGPLEPFLGAASNTTLVDLLVDRNDGQERLRINQSLSLSGKANEVLFLDLRLYGRSTPEDERNVLALLLSLARQAPEGNPDLPWPGFSEIELRAVDRYCRTLQLGDGTNEYHTALTLLPRLVALVDPRLPIVIFSSTGQRTIAQALERYGTIILDFEKPRLFPGSSSVGASEAKRKFQLAFRRALRIAKGRKVLAQFQSDGRESKPSDEGLFPAAIRHVDLYFDEGARTAEPQFRLCCLAIGYEAQSIADKFNRWMVNKGLLWSETDLAPNPEGSLRSKCDSSKWEEVSKYELDILQPVAMWLTKERARVAVFGLNAGIPGASSWNLTNPDCLENRYQSLLQELLEVILFEILKVHERQQKISMSIYIATRIRKENEFEHTFWQNIEKNYGLKIKNTPQEGQYVRTVTSAVFPFVVSDVLARGKTDSVEVIAARAAKLNPPVHGVELPRPSHHLADIAARYCVNDGLLAFLPTLKGWVERGFIEFRQNPWKCLLAASRHARDGRIIEALLAGVQAGSVCPWAQSTISKCAWDVAGWDFIEYCDRLPEVPPASSPIGPSPDVAQEFDETVSQTSSQPGGMMVVDECSTRELTQSRPSVGATLTGKVCSSWVPHSSFPYSYAFILGVDGQKYFFKDGDLAEGLLPETVCKGERVRFTVKRLPADKAGAATNIRLVDQ